MQITFGNLKNEYAEIKVEIDTAINRVLNSGWFILGQELVEFEKAFAAYNGVEFCIGCASGTEAIALALMACEVGPGDQVITVAHTAVPTISAISMIGAIPVFVDIEPHSYLMDIAQVEAKLTPRTRAILPVHLYGQCVNMQPLMTLANAYNLPVIEDCAQAHGAMTRGKKAGTWGTMGAFSFYPSKNLGCYGDGGAVVTNDPKLASKLVMLRNYGQRQRYHHEIIGINSRLDEIQAAILHTKLPYLDTWNIRRREIAAQYTKGLQDLPLQTPRSMSESYHVYHLYVVQTPQREALKAFLEKQGIQSLIHYPIPAHLQSAYAALNYEAGSLPVTESTAKAILSLPMYPQIEEGTVKIIIEAVRRFFV
jgi:dTDP-4-amino-4,6-dideoxygalactose transaminase